MSRQRLKSIDLLRGIAMILMPLDHIRDFLSNSIYSPFDLNHTTPGLFFTRFLVNFCAPIFIFLAGTSMYLWESKGIAKNKVSFFLFTRGLLLIFLEFTLIRTVWAFNFDLSFELGQIFWAIGWSMIALSFLIKLPYWLIIVSGSILVTFHDLLDKVQPAAWGALSWLFKILHGPAETQIHLFKNKFTLQVEDPIIPWIGVIALGYAFGKIFLFDEKRRRKYLGLVSGSLFMFFIVIRLINIYGDPIPWHEYKSFIFSFMSFIKLTKYPPSLDYLLLYLSLSIFFLMVFDKCKGRICDFFITYGRVPLAYYVVHVFVVHSLAVILAYINYGKASWLFSNHNLIGGITSDFPVGYGFSTKMLYVFWVIVILLLYPFCRWYGNFKTKHKDIKILRYF